MTVLAPTRRPGAFGTRGTKSQGQKVARSMKRRVGRQPHVGRGKIIPVPPGNIRRGSDTRIRAMRSADSDETAQCEIGAAKATDKMER